MKKTHLFLIGVIVGVFLFLSCQQEPVNEETGTAQHNICCSSVYGEVSNSIVVDYGTVLSNQYLPEFELSSHIFNGLYASIDRVELGILTDNNDWNIVSLWENLPNPPIAVSFSVRTSKSTVGGGIGIFYNNLSMSCTFLFSL